MATAASGAFASGLVLRSATHAARFVPNLRWRRVDMELRGDTWHQGALLSFARG
jgi:hypothetical protein